MASSAAADQRDRLAIRTEDHIAAPEPFDEHQKAHEQPSGVAAEAAAPLLAMVAAAPIPAAVLDLQLKYVAANHRWIGLLGIDLEDIAGLPYAEVTTGASAEWMESLERALSTSTVQEGEGRLQLGADLCEWAAWSVTPYPGPDGRSLGVLVFIDPRTGERTADDESQRLKAELDLAESRFEALSQLDTMSNASFEEITTFALESAVRLTGSVIGYLSFLNEDETILTMHSWSDLARRSCTVRDPRVLYQVSATGLWGDAIRERHPIITNDYQNSPQKRGYPEGHVHLVRHMNAPIFDAGRIVALIGVGNKPTDYDESDVRQVTLVATSMWQLLQRKWASEAQKESEERYRALISHIPDVTWTVDESGQFTFVSANAEEVLGHPASSYTAGGKQFALEQIHPDDRAAVDRAISDLFASNTPFDVEFRTQTADGRWLWVQNRAASTYEKNGKLLADGVVTDITSRRKAEDELRAREALLNTLVENLPLEFWAVNKDGAYIADNYATRRHWGSIVGRRPEDLPAPENVKAAWLTANRKALHGETVKSEFASLGPEGNERFQSSIMAPIRDDDRIIGAVGIALDVTEARRATEALRRSEERLADIINFLPDAIIAIDTAGKVIVWNHAMEEMTGTPAEQIIGQGPEVYTEVFYDRPRPMLVDLVLHPEHLTTGLYTHVQRDNHTLIAEVYAPWLRGGVYLWGKASPLYGPGMQVVGSIESIRDITARKKAEIALQESEEKFRGIFENSGLGIFQSTTDGKLLSVNPAFARILGYDSVQDALDSIKDLARDSYVRPEVRDGVVQRVLAAESVVQVENEYRRKDGTIITCSLYIRGVRDESGRVAYLEGFLEDITDRKAAEQRRRELEDHKREFYRRTILAATEGKLEILDKSDILRIAGPPIAAWKIEHGEDLGAIRHDVTEAAIAAGLTEPRIYDLALCVGELTTNAFKHAVDGSASLHRADDSLIFVTTDRGHGMEELTLPEVALTKGYSTAKSLGMGYKAMISLADKVYLATGPNGTTAAIEIRLHPAPVQPTVRIPDTWGA